MVGANKIHKERISESFFRTNPFQRRSLQWDSGDLPQSQPLCFKNRCGVIVKRKGEESNKRLSKWLKKRGSCRVRQALSDPRRQWTEQRRGFEIGLSKRIWEQCIRWLLAVHSFLNLAINLFLYFKVFLNIVSLPYLLIKISCLQYFFLNIIQKKNNVIICTFSPLDVI